MVQISVNCGSHLISLSAVYNQRYMYKMDKQLCLSIFVAAVRQISFDL